MNPGIYDMQREDYDRLSGFVNWSTLKHMAKSPAHYRQALMTPPQDTDSLKRGRVIHLATFEPDQLGARCAVWTGGARRGKEWDAYRAKHAGKEIVTEADWDEVSQIQRAVHSSALASKYLSGGRAEATMIWTLSTPDLGAVPGWTLKCRGRPDFIANCGALVDLKTSRDASPDGFLGLSAKYRYHAQAAFYVDGYEALTGKRLPYILVAVETESPFAVTVFELDETALEVGRQHYRELLDRLAVCMRDNHWPSYSDGIVSLGLPRWAMPYDEEDSDDLGLVFPEETAAAQGE